MAPRRKQEAGAGKKGRRKEVRDPKENDGERDDGDHGGTVERPPPPPPPTCDCDTMEDVYSYTAVPPVQAPSRRRYRFTVTSRVSCDPANPGFCDYIYEVTGVFERQQRVGRPWTADANRKVVIHELSVHGPVNSSFKEDRADQNTAAVGRPFRLAPQREKVRVTLVFAASNRADRKGTENYEIELCVPKLENPQCP